MPNERKCMVPGCDNPVHAKGYCRKHYGQIWRKGRIYTEEERGLVGEGREDTDRVRSLERELRRAEMMYKNVIGMEGRLKWRKEIDAVRKEMTRLGIAVVPTTETTAQEMAL